MTKPKTLDQLRAEKERAETQLAQEKHKLERLENRKKYLEKGERTKRSQSCRPDCKGGGCVSVSRLSPDTSFCSPDAPACAVPVQAASRLAPCRLGVVQGFSVSFFVTSFLKMGIKKDRQLLYMGMCVNGQFFDIRFFKLAGGERFVKTVCGRQVHKG